MITANTVADYFLAFANECEELITNLKLNKLVYYTQACHLALFKGPMFEDEIEAWVHGPVLPVVYDTYKHFKWTSIIRHDLNLEEIKRLFSTEQQELLDDIVEVYLPKTAYELEQMTRDEDPWVIARDGLELDKASHKVISHDTMQKYFAELLKQEDINDIPERDTLLVLELLENLPPSSKLIGAAKAWTDNQKKLGAV